MGLLSEDFEPVVYVPDVRIKLLSGSTMQFTKILEHLLRNTKIDMYNMSTVIHACQCAWFFMNHPGWFKLQNLNMDDPICKPVKDERVHIILTDEPNFKRDISGIKISRIKPSFEIE